MTETPTPKPEDKKPAPPRPAPPPAPAAKEAPAMPKETTIPVRMVDWGSRTHMQLPGKQSETTAKAEEKPNGERWVIEYLPTLRHFRITYTNKAKPDRDKVKLVPVERAESWEPLT